MLAGRGIDEGLHELEGEGFVLFGGVPGGLERFLQIVFEGGDLVAAFAGGEDFRLSTIADEGAKLAVASAIDGIEFGDVFACIGFAADGVFRLD